MAWHRWIRVGLIVLSLGVAASRAVGQVTSPSRTLVSACSCMELVDRVPAVGSVDAAEGSNFGMDGASVFAPRDSRLPAAQSVRVDIPDEAIAYLIEDMSHDRRGSKVVLGAMIGGLAGFLIGYAAASTHHAGSDEFVSEDAEHTLTAGYGMLIGAGVGALIGMAAAAESADDAE